MGAKINLAAMLAALGAFFLPWLEVSCSVAGEPLAAVQQTGVQSIMGRVNPGRGLVMAPGMAEPLQSADRAALGDYPVLERAVPILLAAVLVGLGVLFGFVAVGGDGGSGAVASARCVVARTDHGHPAGSTSAGCAGH